MLGSLVIVAQLASVEAEALPKNAVTVHVGEQIDTNERGLYGAFGLRYVRRLSKRFSIGGVADAWGPLTGGEYTGPRIYRTGPTLQLDAFPLDWFRIWIGGSVWGYYRKAGYYLYPNDRWSTGFGADANAGFDLVGENFGFAVTGWVGAYRYSTVAGFAVGPTFRF